MATTRRRKPPLGKVLEAKMAEAAMLSRVNETAKAIGDARNEGYKEGFAAAMDVVLRLALNNGAGIGMSQDEFIAELTKRLHKKTWESGQ